LASNILTLETAYILLAATDALLTPLSPFQQQGDGMGKALGIVGRHIQAIWSASFLQARARACHYRQSAMNGLNDGNAKALIARGIDKDLGLLIESCQLVIAYS
jgi:hypothetical protein